jgi:hypothetical protein
VVEHVTDNVTGFNFKILGPFNGHFIVEWDDGRTKAEALDDFDHFLNLAIKGRAERERDSA